MIGINQKQLKELKERGFPDKTAKELIETAKYPGKTKPRQYWQFTMICKSMGLPEPVAEYKFHPTRKWRVDFAWSDINLAIEIEGGIWTSHSRHTRGSGFSKDMAKYNALTELGWNLLRYEPNKIDYEQIKRVILAIYSQKYQK